MTQPVVSGTAQRLYDKVRPLAWADEDNGWALLYLCESAASMIDELADIFTDTDDGQPGWTTLLDPDLCPENWVDFSAGNFYGIDFEPGLTAEQKRTKWRETAGRQRGRPDAIKGAPKPYLTGTQTVYLTERVGGSPYVYNVATLLSETPDQDAVVAALLRQKPAGKRFNYTAITGGDYDTLASVHADYDEVALDIADYDAMGADPSVT